MGSDNPPGELFVSGWFRRLARPLKPLVLFLSTRGGSAVLRVGALRRLLNDAYESRGPAFQHWFDVLLSDSRVPCSFDWRVEFVGRELLMPVVPDTQRSWNAALVWRWAGNRSIRRLYETYMQETPAGVFFDVGANDGTHTYPFALCGYRCVAFEPQPTCVEHILRVCSRNGFAAVSVVEALVTDEETTEAELFVSKSTWYSSRLRESTERFEAAHAVSVPCVGLDAYCDEHTLEPSLIKIDVEGWESHVLRSANRCIERNRPDLLVEVAPDAQRRGTIWDDLTVRLGYDCLHVAHYADVPFHSVADRESFLKGSGTLGDDYFFTRRRRLAERLLASDGARGEPFSGA